MSCVASQSALLMLRMTDLSDGVSKCTFPVPQVDTYKLDGCDRISGISSTNRPIRVDLWLVTRLSGGPVHCRTHASVTRLRPKHGSFHALFEVSQLEEVLLEQQELVLVGGDRVVEVVELTWHQLIPGVVLPQAAELFDVLAELVVDDFVVALEVAADVLVEGILLVLVLATALLLLLLLLLAIVRTFPCGVTVHSSVFT